MKVTTNLLRAHIKRLQDEVEGDTEQIRRLEENRYWKILIIEIIMG